MSCYGSRVFAFQIFEVFQQLFQHTNQKFPEKNNSVCEDELDRANEFSRSLLKFNTNTMRQYHLSQKHLRKFRIATLQPSPGNRVTESRKHKQ